MTTIDANREVSPRQDRTARWRRPENARQKVTGRSLQLLRIAWLVAALATIIVLIAALPGYAEKLGGQLGHVSGNSVPPGGQFFAAASGVASLVSALLSVGLAALLFRRRFAEPMAIFLSFFLLIYGIVMSGPLEFAVQRWLGARELATILQSLLLSSPLIALLGLFPNGRFVPGWMRWIVLLSVPWSFSTFLLVPFDAESFSRNPVVSGAIVLLFVAFVASGIYAQFYRYRETSTASERQQIRWAIYGFTLWSAYVFISSIPYAYLTGLPPDTPTPWWAPASELGWWLSLNILPICLSIAITRHRLWDIDLVVNRTLVYGALTATGLALYALIVGGMGVLLRTETSLLLPLVATGVAALLFHPLRLRFQRAINRFMYGERDEPFEVLARLGERLQDTLSPEMVYPTIVETVSQALKLPYAAVAVWHKGRLETVESFGKPVADPVRYPLTYRGERVGELQVARRAPDEPFSAADDRVLRNIARQAGAAVHSVQLMADLQASRQLLVTAREEERRRLRRDLHDGLGASLASLHLQTGILRRTIRSDPERAEALVAEFRTDIRATIGDIRRLVYELRPPTLDQLGLVAAVHALARQCSHNAGDAQMEAGASALRVTVDAPEELPPLPAAVEVAAFRIIQEALTNVVRHARATHCTVRLRIDDSLQVDIVDDGVGLPDGPPTTGGVGLISMQERTAELGGTCTLAQPPGGGTRVHATLPLSRSSAPPLITSSSDGTD